MSWLGEAAELDGERSEDEGSAQCSQCGGMCMDPATDGQGITLDDEPVCINCDLEGRGIDLDPESSGASA